MMKFIVGIFFGATVTWGLVACTQEGPVPEQGNPLELEVHTASLESRAVIESVTLPDGHSIGISLIDKSGNSYDERIYHNVRATASEGLVPQSWNIDEDVLLTDTDGTLYAYYPHNPEVSNIAEVPVMTGETDYMYAKPCYGLNLVKPQAELTMLHAMACIELVFIKPEHTVTRRLETITFSSDKLWDKAMLDVKDGTLSSKEGQGLSYEIQLDCNLGTTPVVVRRLIVPDSEASNITVSLKSDGMDYLTTTNQPVLFKQGYINTFTLALQDQELEFKSITINPFIQDGIKDLDFYENN